MRNSNGPAFDQTEGIVPISAIIDEKYKNKAIQIATYLKAITLTGDYSSPSDRTPDEVQKDNEAIDFLNQLADCSDPAYAYGFMLYDETGIMKQYWAKRCGKLRKNKTEFFNQDVYLEWLINVFKILNGDHESIHDPLYYYKPAGETKRGVKVGNYDIMNSFRVYWNMYCLPILAQWLFKQDQSETDFGAISIEGSTENADAGHHLDAEMAAANGAADPEQEAVFDEVEAVLRSFTRSPWSDPINAGSKAGAVTYLDVMKAIVAATCGSLAGLRKELNLSQSVQTRAIEKIKNYLDKNGITIEDLGNYISKYPTTAKDILEGDPKATFRNLYN